MSSSRKAARTLLVALVLSGAAAAAESVEVEIDVYSGRPNPAWTMTPEEGSVALRMYRALPGNGAHPSGGLGYRGAVVRHAGLKLRLFDGYAQDVGAGTWKRDTGRKLERYVVATGEKYLDPVIFRSVMAQAGLQMKGRAQ